MRIAKNVEIKQLYPENLTIGRLFFIPKQKNNKEIFDKMKQPLSSARILSTIFCKFEFFGFEIEAPVLIAVSKSLLTSYL